MKIKKVTRRSSLDNPKEQPKVFEIKLPTSWDELTDKQLYFLLGYRTMAKGMEVEMAMFRQCSGLIISKLFNGVRVAKYPNGGEAFELTDAVCNEIAEELSWVLERPKFSSPRLICLWDGVTTINPLLQGVPFSTYLKLENLWQSLLQIENNSGGDYNETQRKIFRAMVDIIYQGNKDWLEPLHGRDGLTHSLIYWFVDLHELFYKKWPHLFKQPSSTDGLGVSPEEVMNAEIRALTAGDITKEEIVLQSDTWRALTELNEKAREAQEFKDKIK